MTPSISSVDKNSNKQNSLEDIYPEGIGLTFKPTTKPPKMGRPKRNESHSKKNDQKVSNTEETVDNVRDGQDECCNQGAANEFDYEYVDNESGDFDGVRVPNKNGATKTLVYFKMKI